MEIIKNLLYKCVSYPEDQVYDKFIQLLEDYIINSPGVSVVSDLKTIKRNKNKLKGDIFEVLCLNLIKNNSFGKIKCKDAWLFKDLPGELRDKLAFNNGKDMGIDIIVLTVTDEWYAIQCKYRKKPNKKSVTINKDGKDLTIPLRWQVKWAELSTFYSLCDRTGIPGSGWSKHVVITTAESINRQGRKNEKDLSICVGTFRGLPKEEWLKLLGDTGNKLNEITIDIDKLNLNEKQDKVDVDLIRKKRLLALEKK